jgi:hypothetical protein
MRQSLSHCHEDSRGLQHDTFSKPVGGVRREKRRGPFCRLGITCKHLSSPRLSGDSSKNQENPRKFRMTGAALAPTGTNGPAGAAASWTAAGASANELSYIANDKWERGT